MWFKNLRIYRFSQPFELTPENLSDLLAKKEFTSCGKQSEYSYGWVPPLLNQDGDFVHTANGCIMICAKKQERLLPTSVINEALNERIAEIADREGRVVGRKARSDLKDEIRFDLLPRAFVRSSTHYAYIVPKLGWLILNVASDKQAEEFLETLRDAIGSLPVVPLVVKNNPAQSMSNWISSSTPPKGFEIGQECELRDPLEKTSVIRCKHQDLGAADIINHVHSGMEVAKLALTWSGGIDFIVDDNVNIKRLSFADEIQEQADEVGAQDEAQQFDIDFSIMTIELEAFIHALIEAFGGLDAALDVK